MRECINLATKTITVTATPYSHFVHNKELKIGDIAPLEPYEGYNGIEDIDITSKEFNTKTCDQKDVWEDGEIRTIIDEICNNPDTARVLVTSDRRNSHQTQSVLLATMSDATAFLTYNGTKENIIKVEGIDIENLSFVNAEQEAQAAEDGWPIYTWDRNEATISEVFEELENAGIRKSIVFSYDLASRGIAFEYLTHQILVRPATTCITNVYQALRILGGTAPGATKKKQLYTTDSINIALRKLATFDRELRACISDGRHDDNELVSTVLSTVGLRYDRFGRDIVSPTQGRIQQTVSRDNPQVKTLHTK
mmetsp:Transcript_10045/g.13039  ORF Transcript_10045/g.13039 Transcript_10045/m.13039 type:complete len:309 (+) Transcript_10045:158-1084(+)